MAPLDLSMTIIVAMCMIERTLSLSCPCWFHKPTPTNPLTYAELYCNLDLQCPPGSQVIPDHCGCCSVCSHVENEECGGPWYVLGHCSEGLECIDPRTNSPVKAIYGNIPSGKCQRPGEKVAPPTHAPWCPWCSSSKNTPLSLDEELTTPLPVEDDLTTPPTIDTAVNTLEGEEGENAVETTRKPRKPKKNRRLEKMSKKERKEKERRERKERKERERKLKKQRKVQKNAVRNEISPF